MSNTTTSHKTETKTETTTKTERFTFESSQAISRLIAVLKTVDTDRVDAATVEIAFTEDPSPEPPSETPTTPKLPAVAPEPPAAESPEAEAVEPDNDEVELTQGERDAYFRDTRGHVALEAVRRWRGMTSAEIGDRVGVHADLIRPAMTTLLERGYVTRDESTTPYTYEASPEGLAVIERLGPAEDGPTSWTRNADSRTAMALRYVAANGPVTARDADEDPSWPLDFSNTTTAFSVAWHRALFTRERGRPYTYEVSPYGEEVLQSLPDPTPGTDAFGVMVATTSTVADGGRDA